MQSFDVVVKCDEHIIYDNIKSILEKMKDTAIRIEPGTLDGSEVHRLQLEGLFVLLRK